MTLHTSFIININNRMIYNNGKEYYTPLTYKPNCCALYDATNNEKYIAVGSDKPGPYEIYIYCFDDNSNKCNLIKTLKNGHSKPITSIKFINYDNNLYLISSSLDTTIILWNINNESIINIIKHSKNQIYEFSIINLNKIFIYLNINKLILFYGCCNGYIYICDLFNNSNLLFKVESNMDEVHSMDISPNGKYLITGVKYPNFYQIGYINWNYIKLKLENNINQLNKLNKLNGWNSRPLRWIFSSNSSDFGGNIPKARFLSNNFIVCQSGFRSNMLCYQIEFSSKNNPTVNEQLNGIRYKIKKVKKKNEQIIYSLSCRNNANLLLAGTQNGGLYVYIVKKE